MTWDHSYLFKHLFKQKKTKKIFVFDIANGRGGQKQGFGLRGKKCVFFTFLAKYWIFVSWSAFKSFV
jgi:hypothetical protein